MKRAVKVLGGVLIMVMMVAMAGIIAVSDVHAGAKVVKIEGAEFSVKDTMVQNISRFKDKRVIVILMSGEQVNGKVVDVNDNYLHLTGIERADFLDALINMEQVSGVKAQVRKYSND